MSLDSDSPIPDTLTISPRNLILTLHAHLDFLFILDCLVIGCTADGGFIRIGFPPISIFILSLADFSHPSVLGRPFCSFLQVVPRDNRSFLNSNQLLGTKPDFKRWFSFPIFSGLSSSNQKTSRSFGSPDPHLSKQVNKRRVADNLVA